MSGRRRPSATVLGAALLLAAWAAVAGDDVTLTGWITCEYCGKANANVAGRPCVLACAGKGARLLLWSRERLYRLSDQALAREHVGHEVMVRGTLESETRIRVRSIEKKTETDQPAG